MKKILLTLGFVMTVSVNASNISTALAFKSTQINIVPRPVEAQRLNESFTIDTETEVTFSGNNENAYKAALFFISACKEHLQLPLKNTKPLQINHPKSRSINFLSLSSVQKLPKEGYFLKVTQERIEVRANDYAGFFYGIQSILQLIPQNTFKSVKLPRKRIHVTGAVVKDYPRFGWRAMMLDCSRQFFKPSYIKQYIDYLASLKMNVFHWHLTDDDGWRIEIKSWPKLTSKGAWRGKGCVLPASRGSEKDEVYGGFYTQEQIKEVVAYGLERNVNILPEIDVPGHCQAVIASYPAVACATEVDSKSVQGIKRNVWCAGREQNFKMLDDIIRETTALFPFKYIHIGGDEVNKGYWKNCPHCQKLMKDKGFHNLGNVQNYFIHRMERIVKNHDRSMIGWNEIMHGGKLEQDTAIMSWIGTGPGYAAAKKGHRVVMSPGQYTYFDMAQAPGERGHWWAGIVNAEKTYSFDPMIGNDLKPNEVKNIFGVEGCLWSEYLDKTKDYKGKGNQEERWVESKKQTDFQTFPRLCSLAEMAWTPQPKRDWNEFKNRLANGYLKRLDAWQVNYRIPTPTASIRKGMVTIYPPYVGAEVRYTVDGATPTKTSSLWKGEPKMLSANGLRMVTFRRNGNRSPVVRGAKPEPVATWNEKSFGKKSKNWVIDLSKEIDESGNWTLDLRRNWGKGGVEIESMSLLENGKVIYSKLGPIIVAHKKNNRAIFTLPIRKYQSDSTYSVILSSKFFEDRRTRGIVILDKSPWLEPVVEKVESNMSAYGNNIKENVADWKRDNYFWLNRQPRKGDQITVIFKKSIKVKEIEVLTGKPNQSKDILVDGILEVSKDCETFKKVSGFEFGTAKAKLNQKVKAIRIKCISGQAEEWLIIQDIRLK